VLDRVETLVGEPTAIRRVYVRMLAHTHAHRGQLIAYTRAMGLPAPWPDWREASKQAYSGTN
jgi:uncharacterized damage-inducible protein DinB